MSLRACGPWATFEVVRIPPKHCTPALYRGEKIKNQTFGCLMEKSTGTLCIDEGMTIEVLCKLQKRLGGSKTDRTSATHFSLATGPIIFFQGEHNVKVLGGGGSTYLALPCMKLK